MVQHGRHPGRGLLEHRAEHPTLVAIVRDLHDDEYEMVPLEEIRASLRYLFLGDGLADRRIKQIVNSIEE